MKKASCLAASLLLGTACGGSLQGVCTASSIRWAYDGGFRSYVEQTALDSCVDISLARTSGSVQQSCSGGISADNRSSLLRALASEEVKTARPWPFIYGFNRVPVDGSVFTIELDDRRVVLGDPCGGSPDCTDVPDGLAALKAVLEEFTEDLRRTSDCAGLR